MGSARESESGGIGLEVESFDGDALVDAVRAIGGESIRSVVAFDTRYVSVLYVDESVEQTHGSIESIEEMAETMHGRTYLDLAEAELLKGVDPVAGEVVAYATFMDNLTHLRIVKGKGGVLVTMEPDVPTESVLAEARSVLESN